MKISVSILNSKDRNHDTLLLNNTEAEYVHIDVMDGKFVSNKQFSIEEIRQISLISKKKLDIHLMVDDPLLYIEQIKDLKNIAYITVHAELKEDLSYLLETIRKAQIGCGIALDPDTPIQEIIPYYDKIDLLLLMSVHPGRGGQEFIDITSKIKKITSKECPFQIEVDGGIHPKNIKLLQNAKVDIAVIGSYITQFEDFQVPLSNIKKVLKENL